MIPVMAEMDDFDPANMPRFPPTDESGDVDLTLIEHQLTLTPAQRLAGMESFVNAVHEIRRLNWGSDDPISGID
jgi:hypothetical protein